ncbi:hypothetical protein CLOM_g23131 [Closterium sp. NIES-68]|nr:hypothetical protein CLOM_g23131 [Closterium sp. NIES-68]GJP83994.1 hypothetical protein CLOP_g14091 [Closterium sp. NIES-67]
MNCAVQWMALLALLLTIGCMAAEASHAAKPAPSSELPESLPTNRRLLSPTSRRLLSPNGFSDSDMAAMHDSMWRWRNSMDRSRHKGGMMGGRGGMMGGRGGRGGAGKEAAESESFPDADCGGGGDGGSQEAPHLELIRRSMRAVGLIGGSGGDESATTTSVGSSGMMRFGGRRGMDFPPMHMHHGRMHVPLVGMSMGMGNMHGHPMHFRADVEPPRDVPLRDHSPCAFFSSICDFFRRLFGVPSPAIEMPPNEDTPVGFAGNSAQFPRRMMRGRAAMDASSMNTYDALKSSLANGLVLENAQEHDMNDVPGMGEMMGGDGMMMEGDDMTMQGGSMMSENENMMMMEDGMGGIQTDGNEMQDIMEGMMGGNRMMLRGGNA